jgi:hypothetical protein
MSVFGYNYLTARLGSDKAAALKLLQYEGLWGASGDHYAYEVLNLVNGTWRVYDIRNYVSAVYGPVPIDFVVEYLRALEKAGVVTTVKQD